MREKNIWPIKRASPAARARVCQLRDGTRGWGPVDVKTSRWVIRDSQDHRAVEYGDIFASGPWKINLIAAVGTNVVTILEITIYLAILNILMKNRYIFQGQSHRYPAVIFCRLFLSWQRWLQPALPRSQPSVLGMWLLSWVWPAGGPEKLYSLRLVLWTLGSASLPKVTWEQRFIEKDGKLNCFWLLGRKVWYFIFGNGKQITL